MHELFDQRRYLIPFRSQLLPHVFTDVLVIGSGVAGMRAAIEAARHGDVILLSKDDLDLSCTAAAQGGIASAQREDDSAQAHGDDTISAGAGLCSAAAVKLLVTEGPERIEELLEWGMRFDRDEGGALSLGREGGHSHNRVVHAHGDQTGRELVRTLKKRLQDIENIRVFEDCYVIDFLVVDGICSGAVAFHKQHGHQLIWAAQTILASGGCGQLWRETTNPSIATGDGIAAAYRAGATLRDLELMQFHPTTLYVAGAGRALISEAVRGEGAHLVDRSGARFMRDYDPAGELAPRDIVSRAIHHHLKETRANCAYLDVRHLPRFKQRFPFIAKLCADFEIDTAKDLIPVRPSAHYLVGGVYADPDGLTTLDGLLCCGEAASSGIHGANRLASNSLLEGLVFGRCAGETAGRRAASANSARLRRVANENPRSQRTELHLSDIRNSLRSVMWRNVGIERDNDRLTETCDILNFWGHYTLDKTLDRPAGWEMQNMLTLARLVAMSALERTESIGVHYRTDAADAAATPYHLLITRNSTGTAPVRSTAHTI